MKTTIALCALLFGGISAWPTHAAGALAEVEVMDRDTGQQLQTFYHHGEYWVAGSPGAHYAIYIRNHLGERLLAVTSVDGVNVISGQSAAWGQSGYVLDPGESYQVSGWRKSDYQIAAFAFTAAPRSYAARTGRPDNIGVIGVALFRERTPLALLPPPEIANGEPRAAQRSAPAAGLAQRQSESAAAAPSANADSSADIARLDMPPAQAPALGTAHGEREYSYVAHTQFMRRQSQPDEIVRIRYDSLDNLIAMGVVRPHRFPGARPSPFPSSDTQAYVPDPPVDDGPLPH